MGSKSLRRKPAWEPEGAKAPVAEEAPEAAGAPRVPGALEGAARRVGESGKLGKEEAGARRGALPMRHRGTLAGRERPGHDRVRDSGGGAGGDSDHSHHAFPAEDPRIVGCHSNRHQRPVRAALRCVQRSRSGQGTLEYALITAGFLSVAVALGALWHVLGGGLFVEHALASASHHVQAVAPERWPTCSCFDAWQGRDLQYGCEEKPAHGAPERGFAGCAPRC